MDEFLESVKLYAKIDYDFEDEVLLEVMEAVADQLLFAIDENASFEDFKDNSKFKLALMKQVKEEYEHRGLSADSMRYPLANGVLNIIHQLRLRGDVVDNT